MRIVRFGLRERTASLASPARNARREWNERRGLWLGLWDEEGRLGQGEASPLPGYSPDGYAAVHAALVAEPWTGFRFDTDADEATEIGRALARVPASVPAARFAVETALLDLWGQRVGRSMPSLLSWDRPGPSPVAQLLSAEPESALPEARRALSRGVTTLKVKVGRPGAFDRELDLLRVLRSELGAHVRLRLDANGSFPRSEVLERLAQLAAVGPELVEEPVSGDDLEALEDSPVPIAVDESLHGPAGEARLGRLLERAWCTAVVLKPTPLGGLFRCRSLADRARRAGKAVIASHTFEGPIAFRAIAAFAVSLPAPRAAAGLGPHAGLAAWPDVALPWEGARLTPWSEPGLGLSGPVLGEDP